MASHCIIGKEAFLAKTSEVKVVQNCLFTITGNLFSSAVLLVKKVMPLQSYVVNST